MPNQKTYPSAFDLARHAETPTVWFFFTGGNALCFVQAQFFQRARQELRGRARFHTLDVGKQPELAARFGVKETPTVAVSRHCLTRWRSVGLTVAEEIMAAALTPPDPASYSAAQTAHKN